MDQIFTLLSSPSKISSSVVIAVFILFCRIGGCLMLTPGYSSTQIPMRVRLMVAIAVTLALSPILINAVPAMAVRNDPIVTMRYIASELLVGITIGFLGRLFFFALETLGVAAASGLGLSNIFGVQVDAQNALPPFATFISLTAVALIFITNLHIEILRGLLISYEVRPISDAFRSGFSLNQVSRVAGSSYQIALRVFSPFIIYAMIVNLAVSLINRLTPQIAIYYLAAPFVIGGGMILLYFVAQSSITEFIVAFTSWLRQG